MENGEVYNYDQFVAPEYCSITEVVNQITSGVLQVKVTSIYHLVSFDGEVNSKGDIQRSGQT